MHDRLPETLPLSELDLDERDGPEEVGLPHNNSDESEGETSPDDQHGAGEENADVVALQPMITFGGCSGCGQQAFAALLGQPDALVVFEQLLLSEKLNLLCLSCGEDIDPANQDDD